MTPVWSFDGRGRFTRQDRAGRLPGIEWIGLAAHPTGRRFGRLTPRQQLLIPGRIRRELFGAQQPALWINRWLSEAFVDLHERGMSVANTQASLGYTSPLAAGPIRSILSRSPVNRSSIRGDARADHPGTIQRRRIDPHVRFTPHARSAQCSPCYRGRGSASSPRRCIFQEWLGRQVRFAGAGGVAARAAPDSRLARRDPFDESRDPGHDRRGTRRQTQPDSRLPREPTGDGSRRDHPPGDHRSTPHPASVKSHRYAPGPRDRAQRPEGARGGDRPGPGSRGPRSRTALPSPGRAPRTLWGGVTGPDRVPVRTSWQRTPRAGVPATTRARSRPATIADARATPPRSKDATPDVTDPARSWSNR
jgi:hypothetical protein